MKTCTVCTHPQRAEIDKQLVGRVPLRKVVERYGTSTGALSRHSHHIAGAIAKATDAALASTCALAAAKAVEQAGDAQTLLSRVQELNTRAIHILDAAQTAGQHQVALQAIREARACMELLGKLSGELQAKQINNVAVAVAEGKSYDRNALMAKILGHRIETEDLTEKLLTRINGPGGLVQHVQQEVLP
jgi:hypothetical protein